MLDPPEVVTKKVRKAEAVPQKIEGNGMLALAEFVLLPVSALKTGKKELKIERPDGQEPLVYTDVKQMNDDYQNDVVCSQIHHQPKPTAHPCPIQTKTNSYLCSS